MAEAMLIGLAVGLLQQAIPAGIRKLRAMCKQVKATVEETRELEDFLHYVQDIKYNGGTGETTTVSSSLATALTSVQENLDTWSSQNSGFFSRSSGKRMQDLRALRGTLERAITLEMMSMLGWQQKILVSIHRHVVTTNRGQAPLSLVDTPPTETCTPHHKTPSKVEAPKNPSESSKSRAGYKVRVRNKVPVRSKSADRATTNASKQPDVDTSRSKSVHRKHHDSSRGGEKRHTVDLWVSLDSEKQAKDVENKLMGLPDVKKVFFDLVTKKVTVMLVEESKVRTTALLSEIQNAQPIGKVAPKRWFERPR